MSATAATNGNGVSDASLLKEILDNIKSLKQDHTDLATNVDAISGRVNVLAGVQQVQNVAAQDKDDEKPVDDRHKIPIPIPGTVSPLNLPETVMLGSSPPALSSSPGRHNATSKIILTSYPGQAGVDPLPLQWGAKDPTTRGPVVVSRNPATIRRRNGESNTA